MKDMVQEEYQFARNGKKQKILLNGLWIMGIKKGLQLDRKDNSKGYSPDICRFVSPKTNSRNRRNTKHLTVNGETKCVAEWCESIPISPFTVYWWIRERGKEYAEQRLSEIA